MRTPRVQPNELLSVISVGEDRRLGTASDLDSLKSSCEPNWPSTVGWCERESSAKNQQTVFRLFPRNF